MVCAVKNMILIRFNLPIIAYEISVLSARYNKNKEIWVHELLILVVEQFIPVCKYEMVPKLNVSSLFSLMIDRLLFENC